MCWIQELKPQSYLLLCTMQMHHGELQSRSGLFLDIVGIGGIEIPIEGYIEVTIQLEGISPIGSFMIVVLLQLYRSSPE